MTKGYDVKCHDLAVAFLSDVEIQDAPRREVLTAELAQEIQDAIESFIRFDVPTPSVTINSEPHIIESLMLAYEDVVRLAGLTGHPTARYSHRNLDFHGILSPGKSIRPKDGMHITCVHTGDA